ncbi:MAG: hypothetical protein DMG09_23110 [Acidobacteria bacterium]|nr:MAG: hypothetical protein DMG09_23110 [Acidobacteriota bacterium]
MSSHDSTGFKRMGPEPSALQTLGSADRAHRQSRGTHSPESEARPFSAHDLRRTCATRLGQMQVPGHVIARILNHKQTDVTSAVYNKYQYLKEKRQALDLWGAKVARIVSGLKSVGASPTEA